MRLRNLIILWVVLSLAVGLYTYTLTQENYAYTLPFLVNEEAIEVIFPIALWVVIPVAMFFAIVCCANFVSKIKNNIRVRHFKNDFATLMDQIHAQAAHESFSVAFKTEEMEKISLVLQRFVLDPNPNSIPSGIEKIDTFLTCYKALMEGESIDIRKLGVANDSPLVLLEKQNRLSKDVQYAFDTLKRNSENPAVIKIAFLSLFNTSDEANIRKYMSQIDVDKEIAEALLQAILSKKIAFNLSEVSDWIDKAEYSQVAILQFSIKLKKILDPDLWLKFAEDLANRNEIAEETYLYVLADLEMISSLKDRLKLHAAHEFIHVRAFVELRDHGKNYPLNAFFVALP